MCMCTHMSALCACVRQMHDCTTKHYNHTHIQYVWHIITVFNICVGSIFSRLMETPAKKLRELASASVVKSSSLLRSRKIASRTPSRTKVATNGMSPSAIELVPIKRASPTPLLECSVENPYLLPGMFNLSPPAVLKPQYSHSSDIEDSVPVRRSPRLRAMMQSKIKSSPNVGACMPRFICG